MSSFPLIPGYKIKKKIGEGSFSMVCLAIRNDSGRPAAIKILKPPLMKDSQFKTRFMREAETIARLNHPNIIPIYDFGQAEISYYFVMELLEETLSERLRRYGDFKMNPGFAIEIIKPIIGALDYVHNLGIMHRDIKPGNIMFRKDNTPVLLDFSLALILENVTRITSPGTIMGTPHYMSPEQFRGESVDGRSDFYSLGAVFFEILTGKPPYKSETIEGLLYEHINSPLPRLPEDLIRYQPLIDKMMAKKKEDRLSSGKEFEQILNKILKGQAVHLPKKTSFKSKILNKLGIEIGRSMKWDDQPELKLLKGKLGERFELLEYIGTGGFSRVFKAKDHVLNEICTLTILKANESIESDAEMKIRFQIAAKALARCRHPNIISIYDTGEDDELPYHIGEYIEGTGLEDIISKKGKLELSEVMRISQEVLAGLGYMHERGLIYRSLKPKKILLEQGTGRVVLTCSSIVIDKTSAIELEEKDSIIGTLLYMAPEQFLGNKNIGLQTDIYSFGVLFYEMLTGETPFNDSSPAEIMNEHINDPVPNVRDIRPDLPEGFENIIFKAMAKDPEDRYANTQELLKDIQNLLGNDEDRKASGEKESIIISVLEGDTIKVQPSKLDIDSLENKLRTAVLNKLYPEGKQYLQTILNLSPEREGRLQDEFGYIYNFEHPEKDETDWKQKEARIEWRQNVWRLVSARNVFDPVNIENTEDKQDINGKVAEKIELKKIEEKFKKIKKKSEEIGEDLEQAVFKLFHHFLETYRQGKDFTITNERQQARGQQSGHDLKFVCLESGKKKTRFLVECKNLSRKITLDDIAGKLSAAEKYHRSAPIDHWILVSPNENVSNELEELLEYWEKTGKYPFNVQAWTPATRVKEFFGLIPGIYDEIIKEPDLVPHPKDWNEEKKKEVIESWKQKLEPPVRLPQGWEQYLRNPGKLTLEPKEIDFERLYNDNDYVAMNCKDETGAVLIQTLEEKILNWLEEPLEKSPTLFLLGEFGDGKTFFTYTLTRKLVEKFLKSPKDSWIPVRFALKNFTMAGITNARELLRSRLEDFDAGISGWNDLRTGSHKILAILDGFDEISKELDPDTIQKNIDILIDLYGSNYFSGMKLLITSRKHFFENQIEKNWLIDKLDNPQMLHLAPIDRKTAENHLRTYAVTIGEEEKFNKIKDCHDPIDMASKPLFLEMLRYSLKDLPEEDLNEYILYETYILNSLKRKIEYNYDKQKKTPKEEIINNLLNLMELVAQRLHQKNQEYVYLSDIRVKEGLAKWLWDIIAPDAKTIEDETGHAATRSLLKRVQVKDQPETKKWPVDFCHRSIREYFTARAVCNMLQNNLEEAKEFLTNCFLNYEILFFAGEIMKHKDFNYEANLLNLIQRTKKIKTIDRVKSGYLGGNAVNLLYRYKGRLPGSDWSNLLLDGAILSGADLSGKNFSHTSLQYANLDNVNLTGADFSNCNLSEVRIEETTPVQSAAISPGEKILALYHDGVIREWSCQGLPDRCATNLSGNIEGKEMKLIAQPGNDLAILQDRHILFYDRIGNDLKPRAAIEINPDLKVIKITRDTLLLNEKKDRQNRLLLLDLSKHAIIKSHLTSPFTLCDNLGKHALVIFNEKEELHLIDIIPGKRPGLIIPTEVKVSCITTCKCAGPDGQYLLGLGLYNGFVQIWEIDCRHWNYVKLLEQPVHKHKQPVKDILFMDESRIVSGGLDKTIKLHTFNREGKIVGEPREFKMVLQCRGLNVEGVMTDKEQKKLKELITNAPQEAV